MTKILFVCYGNICRSPMAEYVFKNMVREKGVEDQFYIASAAVSREELGNDIHQGTKEILRKYHIPFESRQAWQVSKKDYELYDYFVAMDSSNLRDLNDIFGGDPQKKIYKLFSFIGSGADVADPWYTRNFEITYEDVCIGCEAMLDFIMR